MTDQLDSPRVITNALGEVTNRRDFKPFGEEIAPESTYRTAQRKYGVTDNIRQKFTGYQKDTETQLDFAEARMYQNLHGRFTAVDPLLASGKSANPQTFNRYVYVINNPLILTDPTGLQVGKDNKPCETKSCPNAIGEINREKGRNGRQGKITSISFYEPVATVRVETNLEPLPAGNYQMRILTESVTRHFDAGITGIGQGIGNFGITLRNAASPLNQLGTGLSGLFGTSNPFQIQRYESDNPFGASYSSASETGMNLSTIVVGGYFGGGGSLPSVVPRGSQTNFWAGSIRNVNPLGCQTNCVNVSIATDAMLAGRPASALRSGPTPISELAKTFNNNFVPMTQQQIVRTLENGGNGTRGIIFGSRGPTTPGHVFNGVNQNGNIRFLDGQIGGPANLNGYREFYFLRTSP